MDYVILSDAACDLDPAAVKQENLDFIPMDYTRGTETLSHTPGAAPLLLKAFYEGQRKGDLTKTTQISPQRYEAAMRSCLDKGFSVLYLALSGGLSSTFQTAQKVGKELSGLYPEQKIVALDTKAATGGMGILVERAVRNRASGMNIMENALDLTEAIQHIYHWFMVPDLMYLMRGGRISAAAATTGTVFHIRSVLEIDQEGKLKTIGKARGDHKTIRELLEYYEIHHLDNSPDPVYVVDADAPEIGDRIREKLLSRHPELVIRRSTLSPIIGAHTGPGMAAILHIGKRSI